VLVPALAVDRSGVRLGRGGGSYDRALASHRSHAPVIALLHPGELVEDLPAEPHDVRVDAVALPGRIVRLPLETGHP
jgi:5-formyltetrahydrofolate cyclo-ligase